MPSNPAMIGIVPMSSETVVAVVYSSAYTKQIWLTKSATTAIPTWPRLRRPPMRSECSRKSVIATNARAASA